MKMVILRGLQGSGKTTLAAKLATEAKAAGKTAVICTADDFFNVEGRYQFDASKLGQAHHECRRRARAACEARTDLVAIANTNLSTQERKPYLEMATEFGYVAEIAMVGDFSPEFAEVCAARNLHNVPREKILKLAERFRGTEGATR